MTEESGSVSAGIPTTMPSDAGSGAAVPDFMSFVPEAYREEAVIKDAAKSEKPFETFFESFKYAQSQVGKKGLEVPGEGATEEQIKSFHKALGVPDTIDGYEYAPVDISKEDTQLQELLKGDEQTNAYIAKMKEVALAKGVTPAQWKAMAEMNDAMRLEQARAMFATSQEMLKQRDQAQQEAFQKLYGDKSEHVVKVAKETLAKVLPKEIMDIKDPEIALAAAAVYIHEKVYKNDPVAVGAANGGTNLSGAQAIQSEIDKLALDKSYLDRMHPGHAETQKKMGELYTKLVEAQRG